MKRLNIARQKTLSRLLGFSEKYLFCVSGECDSLYTLVSILKKDGNSRILSKPRYKLKIIQSKIKKTLSVIEIPKSVHGWVKKRSVKTAVEIHRNMKYLYAFDIHSYFDSIHNSHVNRLFLKQLNCSPKVAHLLTSLTTYQHCLPQGSPCSPTIANLILRNFDLSLEGYTRKENIKYSRMGDDILISSNHKLLNIDFLIADLLKRNGLRINNLKTVKNGRPIKSAISVLGVNIGSKITISKDYRRKIDAILHNAEKTGLNAQNTEGRFNCRKHLLGRIILIEMYHPKYGAKLRKKLKNILD